MSIVSDTVGLVDLLASCSPRDGCQLSEELRVHVRVGKVVRAREELLDVGLVRQICEAYWRLVLEDRVVERERVTDPFVALFFFLRICAERKSISKLE